jgi:hypothetical protein
MSGLPEKPAAVAHVSDAELPRLIEVREDGYFWLPRPRSMFCDDISFKSWNAKHVGKKVFTSRDDDGYLRVRLFGRSYPAHRVIWALHYGKWPEGQIDHINGDPADNRIENLRDVSHAENGRNQRLHRTNTSGFAGVNWRARSRRWLASITVNGRRKHIGCFAALADAVAARKAAEAALGYHPNHGRAAIAKAQGS